MRAEDLQEVIRAQPFRPFALMLADGIRLAVPHPEWIYLTPTKKTVIHATPNDRLRIPDVAQLLGVEVEPPVPAQSPDSDGAEGGG